MIRGLITRGIDGEFSALCCAGGTLGGFLAAAVKPSLPTGWEGAEPRHTDR